jgi:DNA-binding transcriptional LysR family regulator
VDLRRLEVFEAIMRSGSASAAARELGMTQSAVSRILARLEGDLGYPLFTRANGRLQATDRAQSALVQARDVMLALSAMREIGGAGTRGPEHLEFVTVPSVAHGLVPSVLRAYAAGRPAARFRFDVRTTESAVDAMVRGLADFALVALPVSHKRLRVTPLFRATSCCVLRADHPLAAKPRISAADLGGEPLIFLLRRQPTRKLIEAAFRRVGAAPDIRIETSNVATACRCAAQGLGVAVVNGLMAGYAAEPGLAIRPFAPSIHHTLALVEPAGRERPEALGAFLACLLGDVEAMARRQGVAVEALDEGHSESE